MGPNFDQKMVPNRSKNGQKMAQEMQRGPVHFLDRPVIHFWQESDRKKNWTGVFDLAKFWNFNTIY